MNVLGVLLVVVYAALFVLFAWATIVFIMVGMRWLRLNPSHDYGAPKFKDEL
ncbi:hypothetical protein [Diaminobutyricibacter sp. McL0608]|uniref:hypothetical protein n=1 Tax=Leifsonia sp. McL0608 TaxID=3143537 RepID=UPI0031F32DFC